MPRSTRSQTDLPSELTEVANAAHDLLRAQADNRDADGAARQRVLSAAQTALGAGHSLAALAAAEAAGRDQARHELRSELLRRIRRASRRLQEASEEHHREIRRAAQIGLSTREIASAADVAHGTVRAMIARPAGPATTQQLAGDGVATDSQPSSASGAADAPAAHERAAAETPT
jgi:hypothetical protein